MKLRVLIVFVLLGASTETLADTPANVLIPFGESALWAAGLKEIEDCKDLKCDEESTFGIPQAMKYALNNARIVVKHVEEKNAGQAKKFAERIDKLLIELEKVEGMDQGKKWKKALAKMIKSHLKLFSDEKLVKLLKDTRVALEISSDDIGLTWRSQSLDLPLYSKEDLKKGLAELRFEMKDGVKIPRVGFGTWMLEGEECTDAVLAALKVGYRHIDTAQSYENEKEVGKGIQAALADGTIKSREDVFLVTKLSNPEDYNGKKLRKAYAKQLKALRTNYTDVYMLHGPSNDKENRAAWKAMIKLQKEGKIKALGISNFELPDDIKKLGKKMEVKPNYIQNKFSIYNPGGQGLDQESMLQAAEEMGMAFVAYSILNPWPMILRPMEDPHVIAISKRYKRTPAQILNRWALQLNTVIIPRSKSAARIEENAQVLEFALGELDMRLLNGLSVLAQSTSEVFPPFVKDVYGLFENDDAEKSPGRDEL